jgi:hypothetical protein
MIELTTKNGEKLDINPTNIRLVSPSQGVFLVGCDEGIPVQESREVIRKMVKLWYRECFGATVNNVMERKM